MNKNKGSTIGINFSEVLLIVFVVLKLNHLINWSWWWVLSPLWGGVIGAIVVILIAFLVYKKES